MDIEQHLEFEKSDKYFRLMKENYANKLSGKSEVITEGKGVKSGFAVGKSLKKQQGVKGFKEETVVEPPKPEDEMTPPPSDVNAPEGDVTTPASIDVPPVEGGDIPPADDTMIPGETSVPPTDAVSGEVLPENQELSLKTQQFAQATIANSLGDFAQFDPATDVLPSGVLKKEVQDPQNGNFTILVFPTEFKAADVVATAYPEPTGAAMDIAATDAANPEGAEVATSEVPTAAETPVDTSVPPVEGEPVPEEEPKPEDEALKEVRLDEKRDPTYSGKKDWKAMLNKLLNESTKKAIIKEEEKKEVSMEDRMKNLQEKLKNATGEEKEAVQEAIDALKSRMAKAKTKEVVAKGQEKHKVSAEDKEKVENTEES
jgi:hypothetical protein